MMSKEPIIAIIGRPNVGKSTLVNRIIGARQAIVDDLPGVTRDRSYHDAEWCGRTFQVVDTGGLIPDADAEDIFAPLVNQQVEITLKEADVVIFLVDGQAGLTPPDEEVAQFVRRCRKPVILAVNKIDTYQQQALTAEFHALGFGQPFPVSAMHGTGGVGDLLDEVLEKIPAPSENGAAEAPEPIRLAVVGRPNVGKSSILNALAGEQRAIVSDISGTTRDAIDISLNIEGQPYILVDTAGIRKKGKVDYGVEMFSVDRSIRTIRKSDVTVMVLDAQEGVTDQDKKIIETSNEAGRGLIVVVNKWDLIPNKTPKSTKEFEKKIYDALPHAKFAKVIFTSAVTKQRLTNIFPLAKSVYENAHRRMKTNLVNQVLMEAFTLSPPAPIKNKRLKLLYATQVGVAPPSFVLFVNDAKLMKESYERYIERKLRESFEFSGTPVVIIPKSRGEKG